MTNFFKVQLLFSLLLYGGIMSLGGTDGQSRRDVHYISIGNQTKGRFFLISTHHPKTLSLYIVTVKNVCDVMLKCRKIYHISNSPSQIRLRVTSSLFWIFKRLDIFQICTLLICQIQCEQDGINRYWIILGNFC